MTADLRREDFEQIWQQELRERLILPTPLPAEFLELLAYPHPLQEPSNG